jgi:hypothetical protein
MTGAEEWLPAVGFEEFYEVSSAGRVKRIKPAQGAQVGRVLSASLGKRGYIQVTIRTPNCRRGLYVHSMVAAAFIGPRPPGYDVNHIDACRTNNCVGNLEYVTRKENLQHASRLGRMCRGEGIRGSLLKDGDIPMIRKLAATMSNTAIAKQFNVSQPTISDILLGKTWKHIV